MNTELDGTSQFPFAHSKFKSIFFVWSTTNWQKLIALGAQKKKSILQS